MYGKCARDITYVPEMYLVETCPVNGSCPSNVPDMFPPVSRGPRPQCEEEGPQSEPQRARDHEASKRDVRAFPERKKQARKNLC